jgi:hypothetical protein
MIEPSGLTLDLLPATYAVAQLPHDAPFPEWATGLSFLSPTRTESEFSIVCTEGSVPATIKAQRGFRGFRVSGPLAFSEVGILDSLAKPLADAAISIFAVSTFETDYLFIPGKDLHGALNALSNAGHRVRLSGAA